MVVSHSSRETSALAQEIQRRHQRQTKHGEVVALHAFKQLDAKTFDLVGADARGCGIANSIKIKIDKSVRQRAHGQPGDGFMFEQRRSVLHEGDRRMQFMTAAGQRAQLLPRRGTIGRLGKASGAKRERLIGRFGERGFDYLGSRPGDFPVWCAARRALLVSPSSHLERKVAAVTPIERVFRERKAGFLDYLHALRVHHWVKNFLVFMPLALAHRFFEFELLGRAALAFLAFNLCASGVYLLNDLLDLPADRRHPKKKERRLASGRIRLSHALVMTPLILAGAFAIAWHLSIGFAAVLAVYVVLMVEYSMKLKDMAIIDVLVLATGYALRVAAGAVAVDVDGVARSITS